MRPAGDEGGDQQIQIAPQDVLDMPVDPNEPTYCLCHQVSYGEMIGCDNPDVSFALWVKNNVVLVPYWVVPFWLRWTELETQGQVVLCPV